MSDDVYLVLQTGIISFLLILIGTTALIEHPERFQVAFRALSATSIYFVCHRCQTNRLGEVGNGSKAHIERSAVDVR